jgi:hypothetical protein
MTVDYLILWNVKASLFGTPTLSFSTNGAATRIYIVMSVKINLVAVFIKF